MHLTMLNALTEAYKINEKNIYKIDAHSIYMHMYELKNSKSVTKSK